MTLDSTKAMLQLAEISATAVVRSSLRDIVRAAVVDCFGAIVTGATSEVTQRVTNALSAKIRASFSIFFKLEPQLDFSSPEFLPKCDNDHTKPVMNLWHNSRLSKHVCTVTKQLVSVQSLNQGNIPYPLYLNRADF